MTSPASPPADQPGTPVTGVRELVDEADRLGLTWQMLTGTVASSDNTAVTVTFDGGDIPKPAVSMIGRPSAGDRVFILFVPPQGVYIVGHPDGETFVDLIDTNVPATTQTTVGAAELDLPRLGFPSAQLRANQLFELRLELITTQTTITDEFEFLLRRDTALTGTILGSTISWARVGTAGQWAPKASIWFKPVTTGVANLFVSVRRNAGAGTITIFYSQFGALVRTTAALMTWGSKHRYRTITT